jgi:hypothetical protein
MTAATRSEERVAPLSMTAWLSVWLRSHLAVTRLASWSLFFFGDPRKQPARIALWLVNRFSSADFRHAPFLHPTAAPAPALALSARMPNCGAAGARRTLWPPMVAVQLHVARGPRPITGSTPWTASHFCT